MFFLDLKLIIFFVLIFVFVAIIVAVFATTAMTVCLSFSFVFVSDSAATSLFSAAVLFMSVFAFVFALFIIFLSVFVSSITVFNEKNEKEKVQISQSMCFYYLKQLKKTLKLRCTCSNYIAKCSHYAQLNKSCHSISKKYFDVLCEIQKINFIFLHEDSLTFLKKLMKIFIKKIEIYDCKIKKFVNFYQDAEDISAEKNLIKII